MNVAQINATCGIGSTGKICVSISELLDKRGVENYIIYTGDKCNHKRGINYAGKIYTKIQALKSRVLGNYGFNSQHATKKLLRILRELRPDIVHLHNIHAHNCNLIALFSYLKKSKIKIVWTFHDCWAFTGYCTHFVRNNCEKWQKTCDNCPQKKSYSWFFDKSTYIHTMKQQLFSGLDMTIVTPSVWLANLVKKSLFKNYPIKVIYNGFDLNIFKPTPSDFRAKYGLTENVKIVLGVAFGWGHGKGLDVFLKLNDMLDKSKYKIVLVGTNKNIDKILPKDIISIHRTKNQHELAEIYTAADVFVNPTREDTLASVNIEANACGTPVVTFKTGGCPECIDSSSGIVVDCDDIETLCEKIKFVCSNNLYTQQMCTQRAQKFDKNDKFNEYLELYNKIAE